MRCCLASRATHDVAAAATCRGHCVWPPKCLDLRWWIAGFVVPATELTRKSAMGPKGDLLIGVLMDNVAHVLAIWL